MMLSDKAAAILTGLYQGRDAGFYELQESHHPMNVFRACDAIRRFLGLPGTTGGLRPGSEFLAVLLGFGREGCLRIFEAYTRETARTDDEARRRSSHS